VTNSGRATLNEEVRRAGSCSAAAAELLDQRVRPKGETTVRCPCDGHANGDANPSGSFNADLGVLHCNRTGRGWDIPQLVMLQRLAHDISSARSWLQGRGHLSAPSNGAPGPTTVSDAAEDQDAGRRMALARSFYAQSRTDLSWQALPAADVRRRVAVDYGFHLEILDAYRVGFLPRRSARDGSTYPASLLWPVKDEKGEIVAAKFRAVDALRDGEKKSTTLGPAGRGVIGWEGLVDPARRDQVIALCAGEKDVDRLAALVPEVVAVSKATGESGGVGPLRALASGREVVLIPDLDDAGAKSRRDTVPLTAVGARVRVADLRPYLSGQADEKDVADLCTKYGSCAAELLRQALERATPFVLPQEDAASGPPAREDALPEIVVGHDDGATLDQAEAALHARPAGRPIYIRSGRLVRVLRGAEHSSNHVRDGLEQDAPAIDLAPEAWLRERLSTAAVWKRRKRGNSGEELVRIDPPERFSAMLAARGEWRHFPVLRGVIESPCLRPDG
jgi:hypothetical protein